MTADTVPYTCPSCGERVQFFPGFVMTCHSKPQRPSHAFTPPPQDTKKPGAI